MPMPLTEMHDAAIAFKNVSLDGRLNGWIGALDGSLCWVKVPSACDMMNVGSYLSGHYQSYGVKSTGNMWCTLLDHFDFNSVYRCYRGQQCICCQLCAPIFISLT
jgi:hypothetical protein